jgi:large subunit ribosomal protein L37Ae
VINMSKSTEKVGSSGRFGTRYGVVVRNRVRHIDSMRTANHECPRCHREGVKRVSSGIWQCRTCDAKFAAGAYSPVSKKAPASISAGTGVEETEQGE